MTKTKSVTLISGNENGWSWCVVCRINEYVNFENKGAFYFQNNIDFYQNYKQKLKEYHKNYYKNHEDYLKAYRKRYLKIYHQTHKINCLRYKNKRTRKFGFTCLNKPFEGSEGHHINREQVVFIPGEIHKHIWHSLNKPETMELINSIAYKYI